MHASLSVWAQLYRYVQQTRWSMTSWRDNIFLGNISVSSCNSWKKPEFPHKDLSPTNRNTAVEDNKTIIFLSIQLHPCIWINNLLPLLRLFRHNCHLVDMMANAEVWRFPKQNFFKVWQFFLAFTNILIFQLKKCKPVFSKNLPRIHVIDAKWTHASW